MLMGGDFNGHIGSDINDFGEVHGCFRIEKTND